MVSGGIWAKGLGLEAITYIASDGAGPCLKASACRRGAWEDFGLRKDLELVLSGNLVGNW